MFYYNCHTKIIYKNQNSKFFYTYYIYTHIYTKCFYSLVMMFIGAPIALLKSVILIGFNPLLSHEGAVGFAEFFAGEKAATHAALEAGKHAVSFEINDDPAGQDFVGDLGYANALHLGTEVELGGCSLLAPVCSSWVWINRGTSEKIK